jgi:hypothetical protein
VGLHIGGAPNDEASRQRLVRLFETKFPDFRSCYPLASDRTANASFGVDLFIAPGGGRAKLKQTRSRLTGKGFRDCMRNAFLGLRFKPPSTGRSTTVSYSLIFKPEAR